MDLFLKPFLLRLKNHEKNVVITNYIKWNDYYLETFKSGGNFMNLSRAIFLSLFLITLLAIFCPSFSHAADRIDDLVLLKDVVQCKKCHEDHGKQWPNSAHATSVSEPKTLRAFQRYIDHIKNNPGLNVSAELKKNCFICHAPRVEDASEILMGKITGLIFTAVDQKGKPKGKAAAEELSKINIDCGVCHLIYGMPEGEAEPNMLYGPGWDPHEEAHLRDHGFDSIGSPYLMSSMMCKRCHAKWPSNTPSIIKEMHVDSYEHFVESDRANKTCQACHMMEGEMIIHNMPVYSGEIGFEVNKTADMIGLGLGGATFFAITMNIIARVGSRRQRVKMKIINDQPAGGDEDER
jgi:hypothetical protein